MSEVRENTAVEELRGYLPKRESAFLASHVKLLDLLDRLYLVRSGEGNLDRYYDKAWFEGMRDEIEAFKGETLEALYGRLTLVDLASMLSSKGDGSVTWANLVVVTNYSTWQREQGAKSKLYSAIGEYGATGEGQTYNLVTGGALSEAEFLVKVVQKIGAWFTIGMEIQEGLPPEGGMADLLVTPGLRKLADRLGAHLEHTAYIHFNLS